MDMANLKGAIMRDTLATELLEELDAFDPGWREHFRSLEDASRRAGVHALYARWALTENGKAYTAYFRDVCVDYAQRNELTRRQIAAEHAMFVEAVTRDGIPELRT